MGEKRGNIQNPVKIAQKEVVLIFFPSEVVKLVKPYHGPSRNILRILGRRMPKRDPIKSDTLKRPSKAVITT